MKEMNAKIFVCECKKIYIEVKEENCD